MRPWGDEEDLYFLPALFVIHRKKLQIVVGNNPGSAESYAAETPIITVVQRALLMRGQEQGGKDKLAPNRFTWGRNHKGSVAR